MTLEELKVVISAETKGLEKAVKGVKSTLNGLTKTVQHTTSNLTRQFDRLGKSMTNSFKSLLKFAGLGAAIAGLVKIGKSAVQVASDLEEIQNVVEVVFGESTKEINQWAKSTLKSFGMTESEAKNVASTFKAMSNGMGIADDAGRAMSMRLAELSADLASFRNTTTNVASTALAGVFTGETEALKKFGVVMTQANLEAFALSKGITKSYNAMSQAEKVALRYQYVMQATADAQGDFARSSGSWANQMRVLKGQWTEFLGVIGQGIKQVLTPLISVMNNILASVITVTKAVLSLLGIDFSISEGKVSSLGGGVGDIAEGLDDATGSAKALNKEIAGFDELETLSSKSGLGGLADDIASAASDLQIEQPEIKMDETGQKMFDSFKQAMEELESWFEKKLDPWMSEQSIKIADWLNKLFGDKDSWGQAGQTVGAGLNTIIHAVDNFFSQLDGYNVGSAFGTFFNNLTTKIDWESLGHGWGEKLKTQLDIAIGFLETYNFQALGESIARALDSVDWSGIGNKLAGLISNMLLAAMDLAIGLSTGHLGENVSSFIDGWAEGWKGEELKKKFLEEFQPAMKQAWDELWSSLEDNEYVGGLVKTLEELTVTLKQILEVLLPLAAALKGFEILAGIFTFLNTGIPILTTLGEKLFSISTWASTFQTAANGMVSPLGFLKGIFYQLTVALTDANGAFLGISTSMATSVGVIAGVVAGIAALVTALVHAYKNNEEFRQSVDSFVAALKTHVADIIQKLKEFYEQHLKPFVESIIELIKVFWDKGLKPYLQGMWDWISNKVAGMVQFIIPIVQSGMATLKSIIGNMIDFLGHLMDALDGVIEFLIGVFTGDWQRAWDGIKQAFTGAINGIVDLLKVKGNVMIGFFNVILSGITSMVNTAISGLNRLKVNVPDWVPGIGGKSWGFNIKKIQGYQIPYLAKGGVIDNPTLAMLGEYQGAKQNPEIAAPENMIRDIIVNANGEMVSAFYQMATQIINAIDNVDMSVQIGDETIAKSAKRGSDQYFKMTGKPMFAY